MKPPTKILTVLALMIGINLMFSLTIDFPHNIHDNGLPIGGRQPPSRDAPASSPATSASPVSNIDVIYRVVFFNVYINPTTVTRYRASLATHFGEQLDLIPNNTHVYYYLIGEISPQHLPYLEFPLHMHVTSRRRRVNSPCHVELLPVVKHIIELPTCMIRDPIVHRWQTPAIGAMREHSQRMPIHVVDAV
jgi:hypothetical protein